MSVKLLGLNCSPRDNSNSGSFLSMSFKSLEKMRPGEFEYDIINLRDLNIQSCRACNVCGKIKEDGRLIDCILAREDDVQGVLNKMIQAHGIIVSTPVYFGLPSDLFSKFIMRTRNLRHKDFALANKVVGVLTSAGRRAGGGETTIQAVWLPFIRNGCVVVGNGDKTCQTGALGWAGKRGDIMEDAWALEQGAGVADRVFTLAKVIQAGVASLNYKSEMEFCYKSGMRQ